MILQLESCSSQRRVLTSYQGQELNILFRHKLLHCHQHMTRGLEVSLTSLYHDVLWNFVRTRSTSRNCYSRSTGSIIASSLSPQNISTVGGFWSRPPWIGRAATIAILQLVRNISLLGVRATTVPCSNRFDCCHRICFPARSVENSTRKAAPIRLSKSPFKVTYDRQQADGNMVTPLT